MGKSELVSNLFSCLCPSCSKVRPTQFYLYASKTSPETKYINDTKPMFGSSHYCSHDPGTAKQDHKHIPGSPIKSGQNEESELSGKF